MTVHSRHVGVFTPADPPRIHVPVEVVRLVFARNMSYLLSGLWATVVALPIALIAVPGPLRFVGIAYLVGWFAMLSPSTGVYMVLLADCYLLWRGKEPLLLLRAIASISQARESERPTVEGALRRAATISVEVNPIANLVVAVLHLTVRHRNQVFAQAIAYSLRVPVERPHSPEIDIGLAAPVIRRVPELMATV